MAAGALVLSSKDPEKRTQTDSRKSGDEHIFNIVHLWQTVQEEPTVNLQPCVCVRADAYQVKQADAAVCRNTLAHLLLAWRENPSSASLTCITAPLGSNTHRICLLLRLKVHKMSSSGRRPNCPKPAKNQQPCSSAVGQTWPRLA